MEQLISSGLSIKDSLEILSTINGKEKSSVLANKILELIKKGTSFATAVDSLQNYFPSIYRGIIRVGNKIGSVEKIFPKLKDYLENQKKIKDKIASALLYPMLVLITAVVAFSTMVLFVFPKLKTMFIELGGTAAIKLEQNINRMESTFIFILILFIVVTVTLILIMQFSKTNIKLKVFIDSIKLKIPLINKYILYREILNFSFAMETLTSSGITIENAIEESLSVISNEAIKNALENVNKKIVKGESLSKSFESQKVFPIYLTKWMLVGEKSGKTDQIFSQIKKYYQSEIDIFTTKFMALIEPILILLIGLILIILIFTIVIPVFSLYGELL